MKQLLENPSWLRFKIVTIHAALCCDLSGNYFVDMRHFCAGRYVTANSAKVRLCTE